MKISELIKLLKERLGDEWDSFEEITYGTFYDLIE
ncbi:hypothetical protein MEG1DRAFT_02572 [Photorhabdus temperata subsp. temperata Meg1]|uniref:Uncharacterized protein n=1 Tax=Photorhabdus temperata subsp. temperata Meg1 TaxID=1393735 RepID=A0A081RVZ0_PHOTE|nr:hypothetical protein MEG1DRAFT_02572 [Photorhabdus temperata subsp. temperata Meg1]